MGETVDVEKGCRDRLACRGVHCSKTSELSPQSRRSGWELGVRAQALQSLLGSLLLRHVDRRLRRLLDLSRALCSGQLEGRGAARLPRRLLQPPLMRPFALRKSFGLGLF